MENINSKKKVGFIFHSSFNVGSGIRVKKMLESWVRDEKMFGSGSGIKHPGSATIGLANRDLNTVPYVDFSSMLFLSGPLL
jgi:hypothetical protein